MIGSRTLQMVRAILLLGGLLFGHVAVAVVEQQHRTSAPAFPGWFDNFGTSVAINGGWMAMGAPLADGPGDAYQDTGAVYMFRREGLQWVQGQTLFNQGSPTPNARFGIDVALDLSGTGPILVVGASRDSQNGTQTDAGAVHVFHYGLFCGDPVLFNCWEKKATLIGSGVQPGDQFGTAVDVDNDTIIVGAILDEASKGTTNTGAAYVYKCAQYFFDGSGYCSGWAEQAQIITPTPDFGDHFGNAVAISGETVAIGARFDDDNGTNAGAVSVYHYEVVGNTGFPFFDDIFGWVLEQKISAGATAGDVFGSAVDLAGDTLVAGAPRDIVDGLQTGSAFVFERDAASTWSLAHTLEPKRVDNVTSDAGQGDKFGASVAINVGTYPGIEDTILVGADIDVDEVGAGQAYWYLRNGSSWDQIQKLTATNGETGDDFGFSVALSPGVAVVGAPLDDLPLGDPEFPLQDAGSVYSFSDQASTAVTLALSANSLQVNAPFTATVTLAVGGLDSPSSQLNGQTVSLEITVPGGGSLTTYPGITDDNGVATFSGLSDFTSAGTYTVKASFAATTEWLASSSVTESVVVADHSGYAVIIEGSLFATGSPDELSNDKTAGRIYQTLIDRGWGNGRIYYFAQDDARIGVDAVATFASIDYELVSNDPDDGFRSLLEKANGPGLGPIYFFLIGQADTGGVFYLNPDNGSGGVPEELLSAQVDAWLDALEANPAIQALPRTVVIGSPNSGDFIPGLSGPSNPSGRVIVTSAAAGGNAVQGPEEQDGLPAASYFVGELVREWGRGIDLRQSYITARDRTELITRIDDSSFTAQQQYVDNYLQRPQLEDSGDGVGSHILSVGSFDGILPDGTVAKDVYLGFGDTQPPNGFVVTGIQTLSGPQTTPLTVEVTDTSLPSDQWTIAIRAPGISLPTASSAMQIALPYARVDMMDGDGIFTVSQNFSQVGKHEIWYWGETTGSGEITITKHSIVSVNTPANQQPGPVSLDLPVLGEASVNGLPIIDWNRASDPDGDAVTYTVLIATSSSATLVDTDGDGSPDTNVLDQIQFQVDELKATHFIVPDSANLAFDTTYYVQILARDIFGNTKVSPPRSIGLGNWWIKSILAITGLTEQPNGTGGSVALEGALVRWTPTTSSGFTQPEPYVSAEGGYYRLYPVFDDSGKVTASKSDYREKELTVPDTSELQTMLAGETNVQAVTLTRVTPVIDTDSDGLNDDEDNCTLIYNPDQQDTNGDGFGNHCDPDLNNDLRVDFADLAILKSVFFTNNEDADLNVDGRVDFADLVIMKSMFFQPPGPSGQAL